MHMRVGCGMRSCGREFATVAAAVRHIPSHPYPRRTSDKGSLWRVRYDRKGDIAEVVEGGRLGPKVVPQIVLSEDPKTGAGGPESGEGVSDHQGAAWTLDPCLCNCHFGKPDCDDKRCR